MTEHTHIIASDRVTGTNVFNPAGDKLGHVEKIMLDKRSGQVAFALMSFGGFLGIGTRFHPLPWRSLKYDTAREGYVVDLDRKTLEEAPTTEAFDTPLWDDELWNRKVYDYYKQPYWRE